MIAVKIADKYNTSVAAISISYLTNQDIDVIPIMFFDDAAQIKEAFDGANIVLTDGEISALT